MVNFGRLGLFATIFIVLLVIPDPIFAIDEIIFGGLTLVEVLKRRK